MNPEKIFQSQTEDKFRDKAVLLLKYQENPRINIIANTQYFEYDRIFTKILLFNLFASSELQHKHDKMCHNILLPNNSHYFDNLADKPHSKYSFDYNSFRQDNLP